jgi:FKBP-type peptidyl-prolyl cis-trans isomerase FklB
MRHLQTALCISLLWFSHTIFAGELSSQKQQYSYTVGIQTAKMLRAQNTGELDLDAFRQAVEDYLQGKPLRINADQMQAAMKKHYEEMEAQRAKSAAENDAKGKAFREKNAKHKNVTTLESGLQYEVIEAGEGALPSESDTVEVHYQGTLIDGFVFDSSRQRGKPVKFNLNQVIPGFKEALLLMKPGAKWKVVIPPELAYGAKGAGTRIGPNETLIFDLELIKVVEKDKSAQ